ncbi:hypothetical protein F5Y09DRAFT_356289 [Xylaria sp. FL1042]|nr:hypothetical protein F5Y09DRAFT_356289 [Xylaria sp. FL1042]
MRKRDAPSPSFVQHAFHSRAGLSNLQLSRDAPLSLYALDIATSHVIKCMPGHARRYLQPAAPDSPVLWGDDNDIVVAIYKMDDKEYQITILKSSSEKEYNFFDDLRKLP